MSQLDGEYLAKMEDVLDLYAQPAQLGRARLCFDERPCQLLGEKLAALPARPRQVAKQDHEYVRHGTAVVLLAYDLDTGQRYAQVRARRTKADYAAFIHQLLTTHYADTARVELVQDNLNTHAYGAFYDHLPAAQARGYASTSRPNTAPGSTWPSWNSPPWPASASTAASPLSRN